MLELNTVIGDYHQVRPLKQDQLASDRVRLRFTPVDPLPEAFRRMMRSSAFDVCEMALTTHALGHAFGKRFVALPIVLHRGFHHGTLHCATGSDIRGPEDLVGRRVAVRAWSQTTGVWVRGILQNDYAVDLNSITWITTEDAHVPGYPDPPGVGRAPVGKSLRGMLLAGEVDAVIGLRGVDPAEMRTVIPDADAAAADWYRRTGVYPANHAVVIPAAHLAEHPWLGQELYSMFAAAKHAAGPVDGPAALHGQDPLPYGMAANRAAIEMLMNFSVYQGLIPRAYTAAELFDPALLAT